MKLRTEIVDFTNTNIDVTFFIRKITEGGRTQVWL